jgi:hypothetical protein
MRNLPELSFGLSFFVTLFSVHGLFPALPTQ